ncbi:MAG: hypothetical protein AAFZ04_15310, partial [Pseudomonadota bacterium]
ADCGDPGQSGQAQRVGVQEPAIALSGAPRPPWRAASAGCWWRACGAGWRSRACGAGDGWRG